jgi:hypothetical protein
MNGDKAIAPDANSTIRCTYGNCLPYEPRDGVYYSYYTTLDGVMEKEDPTNSEFIVPAKLKELWMAKDYGRYANAKGESSKPSISSTKQAFFNFSLIGSPNAADVGDTCLNDVEQGIANASFKSRTNCQLLNASKKLI